MGRGLAQRRRFKNYETAKQEKSGSVPLPPPPGELERKKRKRPPAEGSGPQGPASFRRMLAMKALVESKQGPGKASRRPPLPPPPPQEASGAEPAPKGKRRKLPPADKPLSGLMGRPMFEEQPAAERPRAAKAAPDTLPPEQVAEGPFQKRGMKQSKKEFLRKRRERKRGRAAAEAAEAAGEALREDAARPAFGEQALQPIRVNLKRKHWAGSAEERAQSRAQSVFQQQMARARAQAAARTAEAQKPDLAQSFKRQQRGGQQAPAAATPASLAALAQQGAAAAAAAAGNGQ